jgi:N-acetylglutamate synthase-like GNAT family acetyltransferase
VVLFPRRSGRRVWQETESALLLLFSFGHEGSFRLALLASLAEKVHVKPVHLELKNGEFSLSTDPARLDGDAIYDFLSQTYWGKARSREVIEKSIRNSLCFGIFHAGRQIGFARAVTDYATFCYLADVYILEPYRRRGLARWLVNSVLAHPELKNLRRWCLVTRDAQDLYRKCGFQPLQSPEQYMEFLRSS